MNVELTDDINFDGVKDIMVESPETMEDEGCYGPQKDVALFISQPNGKYLYSSDITHIYNDIRCYRGGGVHVDYDRKQLIASSSGGAAVHGFEVYEVDGIHAKKVMEYTEDGLDNPIFFKVKGKRLVNGAWVDFNLHTLYEYNIDKVLNFKTKNGKGQILLFLQDQALYYAFKQPDDFVTFAYPPHPDKADKYTFKLRTLANGHELEFDSGTVKYIIYDTESVGIRIVVNNVVTNWEALPSTKTGGLGRLEREEVKNLMR